MIPVQNIYYMLAYAFQVLNEAGYKHLATEQFNNVADLCAAILERGVSSQIKRGLMREYLPRREQLSTIRGRVDITDSLKSQSMLRQQMVCTYDEYTENAYLNRILKTTLLLLLKADISQERKKCLRKVLLFFRDIEELDIHIIEWQQHFNRSNQTYQMLISICWLVVKGLLQSNSDGTTRLMDFLDEQRMCRLYEKFILEYYRKEHRELQADASQIPWVLDDGMGEMLPVMQSDITLKKGTTILIIDAKYYARTTQAQYDTHTLHSGNLYQIFTYTLPLS